MWSSPSRHRTRFPAENSRVRGGARFERGQFAERPTAHAADRDGLSCRVRGLAGARRGRRLRTAGRAARTRRLRLGLLVTSNRIRPPAVLGKMATTVDVISGGRLIMGLGVGGTVQAPDAGGIAGENPAVAEYAAYGLTLVPPAEGIARLEEIITILHGMWTRDVFDFHGRYYTLTSNRNEPKPVQQPGPPLLIGGWGNRTLRLVAEHADIWNIPGPPHNTLDYITERSAVLDDHCATIGRDPRTITRSVQYIVSYDDPATDRKTIGELIAAGVTHIVLSLRSPYPPQAARWLADQIITPVRSATGE
ncbi:LLM class flavin-dependent oxidoreductase [Streptomyces sp. NPDC021562]|uniref:LLM class flavin-dependent oxidoreductase n=1 Tax=Streptomyces sp. NPDC021562 TaxID=3155121 RepID=UPI0033EF948C